MKKEIIKIVCLLFNLILSQYVIYAQLNLVPNGDFSNISICPTFQNNPITAINWYMPTQAGTAGATSDNYHVCATLIQPTCSFLPSSIPSNCPGYQFPKVGDGYGGFIAFTSALINLSYKEYLGVKLVSSLENGKKYCVSFYVSLADSSAYAVKEIAAFVSDDTLPQIWVEPLSLTPIATSSYVITDTVNWTLIEGEFIANGGEKFLFIGSYLDYTNHTLVVVRDTSANLNANNDLAYYYLDDVSLYCCGDNCALEIPNVFSPNNDGLNDFFTVFFLNQNDILLIYDRWGLLIDILDYNDNTWDGKNKHGKDCSEGVYYYIGVFNNNSFTQNGFIHLNR